MCLGNFAQVEAPYAAWTDENRRLLLKLVDGVAAQVEIALEQAHQIDLERVRMLNWPELGLGRASGIVLGRASGIVRYKGWMH